MHHPHTAQHREDGESGAGWVHCKEVTELDGLRCEGVKRSCQQPGPRPVDAPTQQKEEEDGQRVEQGNRQAARHRHAATAFGGARHHGYNAVRKREGVGYGR